MSLETLGTYAVSLLGGGWIVIRAIREYKKPGEVNVQIAKIEQWQATHDDYVKLKLDTQDGAIERQDKRIEKIETRTGQISVIEGHLAQLQIDMAKQGAKIDSQSAAMEAFTLKIDKSIADMRSVCEMTFHLVSGLAGKMGVDKRSVPKPTKK